MNGVGFGPYICFNLYVRVFLILNKKVVNKINAKPLNCIKLQNSLHQVGCVRVLISSRVITSSLPVNF